MPNKYDLKGKAVRKLRIPLNSYENSAIQLVWAQQHDMNSRFLEITLYDDKGNLDLSAYSAEGSIMLCWKDPKTEEPKISTACEVQQRAGTDGKPYDVIVADISAQPSCLTNDGKVVCNVELRTSVRDGSVESLLSSRIFYIIVYQNAFIDEDFENSEDYGLLVALINKVSEVDNLIQDHEATRQSQESARDEAESERDTAEQERERVYALLVEAMETYNALPAQIKVQAPDGTQTPLQQLIWVEVK